jgi:CubicO group peptidase (beta-lactamase class C family)
VSTDGRIRIPVDLDTVTSVGTEDHSGIDLAAIERIWRAVTHWYEAGMHPAIQLCLRHDGRVVLNRAIGHGWGNGPDDPSDAEKVCATTETAFCVYSAAKAVTTTVVHMLVERGAFALDDRVCDYLPSYTSHGKDRTTIRHVITHRAGVPIYTGPRVDLKRMDDSDRQEHPGDPGHRDPRSPGLPVDQLWCGRTRCAPGSAQLRDRQTVTRTDREGVPPGDRRHVAEDHPVLEHPAIPDERAPVVQHRVDGR